MDEVRNDWDPSIREHGRMVVDQDNAMRHTCPVAHSEEWGGFWALFKHEDILRAVRDTETFISAPTQTWPPRHSKVRWTPLQSDPPEHRQYRQPLLPFFRRERVQGFEPELRSLASTLIDGVIDEFQHQGRSDIASRLCIPLPAMGMCLLLSLPTDNWHNFFRWTTTIRESAVAGNLGPIEATFAEVSEFALAWIRERRESHKEDVVEAMLHAEIDGRPWTDDEILGTFTLLFSAGHSTTADALSYSIRFLAEHPEVRRRLAANPELVPKAVVEFVRLAAPIRALARTTTKDIELRGRVIPGGEPVVMMWGSGSRDEDVFENPDDFLLERDNRRHLSFGFGIHRCLGEELAKLEMTVVLQEILRKIPDFDLDGELSNNAWPANGYDTLYIRCRSDDPGSTAKARASSS